MADINARTRLLIGTTADWAGNDLVLGSGELVLERAGSTVKMKAGNGTTPYSGLPFVTADPIIPPEYLTEAEGDARYLKVTDTGPYLTEAEAAAQYLKLIDIVTTSTPNKVPRLGATGLLASSMIPLPPTVTASTGPADAGKIVALASTGKIDPSMISITTGTYRGTTNATAALPAGTYIAGDYFINSGTGLAHASWGMPGGTTVSPGNQLVFNATTWDLVGSSATYLPITGGTLTNTANPILTLNANTAAFAGVLPTGTKLHVLGGDAAASSRITVDSFGSNSVFQGRRANGTLAAPTAPLAGEALASVGANGYNGSAWVSSFQAGIFFLASENFTPTTTGTYISFNTAANGGTVSTEKMRLDNAGNLGIGGIPTQKIHAFGTNFGLALRDNTNLVTSLFFNGATGLTTIRGATDGGTGQLIFETGVGSERLRIDATGNVGIGGIPNEKLTVLDGKVRIINSGPNNPEFRMMGNGAGAQGFALGMTYNAQNLYIYDYGATAERLRIDTAGNVGINTVPANPAGVGPILHIRGASAGSAAYITANSAGAGDAWLSLYSGLNASDNPSVVWDSGSDLRFGTSTAIGVVGYAELFGIRKDGRVYGKALHNNANPVTGTTNQYIASGTYTPTRTAILNCGVFSGTPVGKWTRVGNIVTCVVTTDVPAAAAGLCQFSLTLPIATTIAASTDLTGSANAINSAAGGVIDGSTVSQRAAVSITATGTLTMTIKCVFQYEVL